MQEELNFELLTETYDRNRWFTSFGANPQTLFQEPLNKLKGRHRGLDLRLACAPRPRLHQGPVSIGISSLIAFGQKL